MTPEEFIEWIQNEYGAKNRSRAVLTAEKLLKKHNTTIWRWITGKMKYTEETTLLMEKIVENHNLKKEIEHLKKKLKEK